MTETTEHPGWSRFTERTKIAVGEATHMARVMGHNTVQPPHLLIGIINGEDSLGGKVLTGLGVDEGRLMDAVKLTLKTEALPADITPEPSESLTKVLDASLREALSLGQNYIGTEHLLLAMTREETFPTSRLLVDAFGIRPETIRNEVIKQLTGTKREQRLKPEAPSVFRTEGERIAAMRSEARWEDHETAANEADVLADQNAKLTGIAEALTNILAAWTENAHRVPTGPQEAMARLLTAWNDLVRVLPPTMSEARVKALHDAITLLDSDIPPAMRMQATRETGRAEAEAVRQANV